MLVAGERRPGCGGAAIGSLIRAADNGPLPANYPENLRPRWNGVFQRMQGVAAKQNGYALLTVTILVGPDGDPKYWLEPTLKKIEPMHGSSQWFEEMLEYLVGKNT